MKYTELFYFLSVGLERSGRLRTVPGKKLSLADHRTFYFYLKMKTIDQVFTVFYSSQH